MVPQSPLGLPRYPDVEPPPCDPLPSRKRRPVWLLLSLSIFWCWMLVEWLCFPNISMLFGPFILMNDIAPANQHDGWVACVLLVPALFAFPVKPHPITLVISGAAVLLWLFLGALGLGCSC